MTQRAAAYPASTTRGLVLPAWAWRVGVWVSAGIYAVLLSVETISAHSSFGTSFDTSTYDQLLWLLAHGNEPFSSVGSRPMLGDHFQPGLVLLTPLYWLDLGVPGLLAAQSIALALTAPALFALARASGASPALASLPALLWLVCPWVASVNLADFRPSTFWPVLLVLSVLAGLQGRLVLLGVTTVLALSLKEDVSLTYLVFGLILAYYGRRVVGLAVAVVSAVWFVVATRISASLTDYEMFGRRFAGDRGDSVGDAILWSIRHPVETATDIASESLAGLVALVMSTGGLALLAPLWLVLALPTVAYNALSAHEVQQTLTHHYHLGTLTGLFIAAALGVSRIGSLGRYGRLAVTAGVTVAAVVAVIGGLGVRGSWDKDVRLDGPATRRALASIPPDAPVAAAPHLLPHLTQRVDVYMLPEPFIPLDWGASLTPAEYAARAERVRFVAYVEGDMPVQLPEHLGPIRSLLAREGFVEIARAGPTHVFERRRPRSP